MVEWLTAHRTESGSPARCRPWCYVAPSVQVEHWGSETDNALPRGTQHWAQCHGEGGELWVRK